MRRIRRGASPAWGKKRGQGAGQEPFPGVTRPNQEDIVASARRDLERSANTRLSAHLCEVWERGTSLCCKGAGSEKVIYAAYHVLPLFIEEVRYIRNAVFGGDPLHLVQQGGKVLFIYFALIYGYLLGRTTRPGLCSWSRQHA